MDIYSDEFMKAKPKTVRTKKVKPEVNEIPGVAGNDIVVPVARARGRPKKVEMPKNEIINEAEIIRNADPAPKTRKPKALKPEAEKPMSSAKVRGLSELDLAIERHMSEALKAIDKLRDETKAKLKPDESNKESLLKSYKKKVEAIEAHRDKLIAKLKGESPKISKIVKEMTKTPEEMKEMRMANLAKARAAKAKAPKAKEEPKFSEREIDYGLPKPTMKDVSAMRKAKKAEAIANAFARVEDAKRELRQLKSMKLKDF